MKPNTDISKEKRKAVFGNSPLIKLSVIMSAFFLITVFYELIAGEKGDRLIGDVLVHSSLLLLALFPAIYLLLLRPLTVKIKEQSETEQALHESEAKYRFLADNILDVIFELDAGLRIRFLTPSVEKLTGYRVEEMLGCEVSRFLSSESQQSVQSAMQSATDEHLAGNSPNIGKSLEVQIINRNGELKWAEVIATLLFQEGRLVTIVGVTRDIDARKSIETALCKAYNLLEKTISSLNEAVFIVSTEKREILQVNSCAEKMFGYPASELLGAKTSILHLNDDMYHEFGRMMAESYRKNGYFETTWRLKRKDGSVFRTENFVRPIDPEDGSCTTHVCVVRDISERIRFENELEDTFNALAERKTFVESVITNMQSGIIVTDTALCITLANPYVQNLCQKAPHELIGARLTDICPVLAEQLIDGIDANEIPVSFCDADFTIGFTRRDLKNVEGETVGSIINFRDLTEVVKIREKIRQKERLSAMGEVVAGVAHEMRNPLFGMTTVGQILDKELTLDPAHRQLMDSFMRESRRLNNLVQDLLDGTRELKLRKSSVNLCQVINSSILACKHALGKMSINVVWNPPDQIPVLLADAEKLEQIFVNLIHNAIDATEQGGCIEIAMTTGEGNCTVTFTDSGHGVPEKILPNIFDVFFTSKKGGTGMGLYISKNIAEAHNGTLSAENLPGRGARFTLTLPHNGDYS